MRINGNNGYVKVAQAISIRLGQVIGVLFLVTFGITVLVRLLPGDPATSLLPFGTPEQLDALRHDLGLDKNILHYYFSWLNDFVRGDFGKWYIINANGGTEVSSMVAQTLPRTLLLCVAARHFQPVSVLRAIIDSMAMAKLNTLHWHIVVRRRSPCCCARCRPSSVGCCFSPTRDRPR